MIGIAQGVKIQFSLNFNFPFPVPNQSCLPEVQISGVCYRFVFPVFLLLNKVYGRKYCRRRGREPVIFDGRLEEVQFP